MEKAESISDICRVEFPGIKFRQDQIKQGGKVFKSKGREGCVEYFRSIIQSDDMFDSYGRIYDAKPPVKCHIVACSRPIEEWPISKASRKIQEHVYSFACPPNLKTDEQRKSIGKPPIGKDFLHAFVQNISNHNIEVNGNVQALNKIVSNAFSIYDGIFVKVKNRNSKLLKKIEKENKYRSENGKELLEFVEEKVCDEFGHLINPPGINPNDSSKIVPIYGCAPRTEY